MNCSWYKFYIQDAIARQPDCIKCELPRNWTLSSFIFTDDWVVLTNTICLWQRFIIPNVACQALLVPIMDTLMKTWQMIPYGMPLSEILNLILLENFAASVFFLCVSVRLKFFFKSSVPFLQMEIMWLGNIFEFVPTEYDVCLLMTAYLNS